MLTRIHCAKCGATLRVPLLRSMFVRVIAFFVAWSIVFWGYIYLPFAVTGLFPANLIGLYAAAGVAFVVGCAAMIYATHRFVPLVRADA